MVEFEYSYKTASPHAKAQGRDLNVSFKDLIEVCNNIRGLPAEKAVSLLEAGAAGAVPIYYKSHNAKLGHRRELGGKKGRYPKKACRIALGVLRNAIANAEAKNLGNLVVAHACANKQNTYPRLAPKGRRNRSDYETARIEIVLEEMKSE